MKRATKVLALICVLAAMVSILVLPASADTVNSTGIPRTINGSSYTASNVRSKDDDSPTYLIITSASYVHTYVQAYATNASGTCLKNCTWVDGGYAANVVCRRYVQYSVHNRVHEDGYSYEVLRFMNLTNASSSITFTWSPDSSGTYIYAT